MLPQDTITAVSKGGDKLVVGHLNPDKYPTQVFSTDPSQVQPLPFVLVGDLTTSISSAAL